MRSDVTSSGPPDLLASDKGRLGRAERFHIRFVQKSLRPGPLDRSLRWMQRRIGATWIHVCTKNLLHVHGVERLPRLDPTKSYVLVANHRSFFDLYVVTAYLVRNGLPQRILFPVRANFFYDNPLGFVVNGIMSFFAMYPPVFRERNKATLNVVGLDELAWLLRQGGVLVGLHPEGTRKRDDDPYTFLPAQRGIGRIIHDAKVEVVPVFINGLGNDLKAQVAGNFDGSGPPIHVVFGAPIDFGDLLDQKSSPRAHRAIAERTLEVIGELGQEERRIRQAC